MVSKDDTATESTTEHTRTGSEVVVATLEAAGVEHVFGVQGGAIMPVYDALYDSDIRHLTMAHEQGAVHAAAAYGLVSGSPGVCLATSGPGATNLVTGLADADLDSDSVLALTGQAPSHLVGKDAFQEVDVCGMTRPLTKATYFATDESTVGDAVGEAYARSRRGRGGPTLVDLPKDVTQSETDAGPGDLRPPDTDDVPDEADPESVGDAARALADADRPLVLAGGGVSTAGASGRLREFATTYGVPVVTTMPAVGSFPEDHVLAMSVAGTHGTGYANLALANCDVLLAVGTRFDDRLTGGVDTFAPEAEILHVDVDASEFHKNVYADYPLLGDAGTVLDQLTRRLSDAPAADEWRRRCRQWKASHPLDYDVADDEPVKPQFVVEVLDAVTPDETIVTSGVGQHQVWACHYWTFRHPDTWISSHGLGTPGYGLPAAIGARVAADDDRTVVCFEGDRSFLMTVRELAVAVREHLDITVAVVNDSALGLGRQGRDAFDDERRAASEHPWVPAFDRLAEAFGARGFRVDEFDEVAETVEDALAYDGPSVVDFHVDPEEDVFPFVASGGDGAPVALREEHL